MTPLRLGRPGLPSRSRRCRRTTPGPTPQSPIPVSGDLRPFRGVVRNVKDWVLHRLSSRSPDGQGRVLRDPPLTSERDKNNRNLRTRPDCGLATNSRILRLYLLHNVPHLVRFGRVGHVTSSVCLPFGGDVSLRAERDPMCLVGLTRFECK